MTKDEIARLRAIAKAYATATEAAETHHLGMCALLDAERYHHAAFNSATALALLDLIESQLAEIDRLTKERDEARIAGFDEGFDLAYGLEQNGFQVREKRIAELRAGGGKESGE